jgi:hypothetical protein
MKPRAKNVAAPAPEVAPTITYAITYSPPAATQELIFYFGHCIDTLESVVGSMHGIERARVEVLIGTYRNVIMLAQAGGQ